MTLSKKVSVRVRVPASPDDVTVEVDLDLEQKKEGIPFTTVTTTPTFSGALTPPSTPRPSMAYGAQSVVYHVGATANTRNLSGLTTNSPDVSVQLRDAKRFAGLSAVWKAMREAAAAAAKGARGRDA
ncbi:hypothetical protein BV25DRAFT_1922071 [Artomyces pyxidatus]|uniref:Uncharacterized protein n=1 Tax=Artomyces pyxidatus TaxID=48021 RepID=A0ACB8SGX4_9AGAM|nr:hypothetical protein BV25DRAFT_1922071 [Artomyces pyxidatus]